MKKYVIILASCIAAVMLSGCSTCGRFTLVSVDLRRADQIAAAVPMDTAICSGAVKKPVLPADNVKAKFISWKKLLDVLAVIKGRIRIFHVEWGVPNKG